MERKHGPPMKVMVLKPRQDARLGEAKNDLAPASLGACELCLAHAAERFDIGRGRMVCVLCKKQFWP